MQYCSAGVFKLKPSRYRGNNKNVKKGFRQDNFQITPLCWLKDFSPVGFVCLFVLLLTSQVNSYGHGGTVS